MSIVSSSANCLVPPSVACSKIMSDAGIKAWWIGNIHIKKVDSSWPSVGTQMIWNAGGGTFSGQITKDQRPASIEMRVSTPSADSIIIHSFEPLSNGGTRYTKSVEPIFRTRISRFFGPLFTFVLRKFVMNEVKRAAAFADLKS